ncbi:hypothetical protein GCM10010136_05110 [Limoniibacter endophyticus]|uniref:Uncharacterized protein n=1 Tax=Limoniibacter endophyticus TaxID=1565040 RepID=A0A8J3GGA0_9HYPH|nr:hypothetical protein GCM10010136_05110 [Limoniibacter endophyticus]
MRAFCLESRIALRRGEALSKLDLLRQVRKDSIQMTFRRRCKSLADTVADPHQLEQPMGDISRETDAIAGRANRVRRLMTIIGALGATALAPR